MLCLLATARSKPVLVVGGTIASATGTLAEEADAASVLAGMHSAVPIAASVHSITSPVASQELDTSDAHAGGHPCDVSVLPVRPVVVRRPPLCTAAYFVHILQPDGVSGKYVIDLVIPSALAHAGHTPGSDVEHVSRRGCAHAENKLQSVVSPTLGCAELSLQTF